MVMPVAVVMPAMAMPAPVTAVPAPMPMPVPMVSPVHLPGLEAVDLGLCRDRGLRGFGQRHEVRLHRWRQQRRGAGAHSQHGGAGNNSKAEFEKVAAFHEFLLGAS
jgi:hypothetical protein